MERIGIGPAGIAIPSQAEGQGDVVLHLPRIDSVKARPPVAQAAARLAESRILGCEAEIVGDIHVVRLVAVERIGRIADDR